MRTGELCALIAGSAYFATIANARNVPSNIGQPLLSPQRKVVSLSTERRVVPNPLQRDRLRRRANSVEASLDNEVCHPVEENRVNPDWIFLYLFLLLSGLLITGMTDEYGG